MTNVITYLQARETRDQQIASDYWDKSNYVTCDFAISSDKVHQLQNYFPDRMLHITGKNIENNHPIHATLTRFCYSDIDKELKGFNNVYEVGTAYTRTPEIVKHCCITLNDARSNARYVQQAINLQRHNPVLSADLLSAADHKDTLICHNGTENCNYQAQIGFSIHVNYDIPIRTFSESLLKHGCRLFYIYMYLPTSLVHTDLNDPIRSHYGIHLERHNDMVKCCYGDMSFSYVHKYHTWLEYLTTTKVDLIHSSQKYSVIFEIDREWGPLVRIKVVVINYFPGTLNRTVPNYNFLNKLVAVPNIAKAILTDDFQFRQNCIIPRELYDKVIGYLNRMPDDAFKFNAFEAYFNAQCNSVTFDGKLVWHGWRANAPEEMRDVIISCFILGASTRNDRSKIVGRALRCIHSQNELDYSYRKSKMRIRLIGTAESRRRHILQYLSCGLISGAINRNIFVRGLDRFKTGLYSNLHAQHFTSIEFSNCIHFRTNTYISDSHTDSKLPLQIVTDREPQLEITHESNHTNEPHAITICNYLSNSKDSTILPNVSKVKYNPPGDGYCAYHACYYQKLIIDKKYYPTIDDIVNQIISKANLHLHVLSHGLEAYVFINKNKDKTISICLDIQGSHTYVPDNNYTGGCSYICNGYSDYRIDAAKWETASEQIVPNYRGRVVDKLLEVVGDAKTITEIGYAPGHFAEFCDRNKIEYYGYHYTGQGCLSLTYKANNHREFTNIDDIKDIRGLLLIDIGDEKNLSNIAHSVRKLIDNHKYVLKIFLNDKKTTEILTTGHKYRIIKPSGSQHANSEVYITNQLADDLPTATVGAFVNKLRIRNQDSTIITINCNARNVRNYLSTLSNEGIHKVIRRHAVEADVSIECEIITGAAGSGKTRSLQFGPYDVYVAPLNVLSTKQKKICQSFSFEVLLARLMTGDFLNLQNIFVDEAGMIPKGWYSLLARNTNANIILLADPFQIQLVDFNNCYDSDDIIDLPLKWHNNHSLRFGNNTATLIQKLCPEIPTITTNKKDVVKILPRDKVDFHDYASKKYQIITFFQEQKKIHKNTLTIHESQGLTFPKVLLYVDGLEISGRYIRDFRYTYVGCTRHEQELLIVYNAAASPTKFVNICGSILDVNIELANLPIVDDIQRKVEIDRTVKPISNNNSSNIAIDIPTIEEILFKVGVKPDDSCIVGYSRRQVLTGGAKNVFGDKAVFRLKAKGISTNETIIRGFRPSTHNFVAHYTPKDYMQELNTIAKRYSTTAKRRNQYIAHTEMIKSLQRGLLSFTAFKNQEQYYEFMSPTFEELQYHLTEYISTLQEKINPKLMTEVNTLVEDTRLSIDFFMKKQPKFISKPITELKLTPQLLNEYGYEEIFCNNVNGYSKVGQGVSSWPKNMNLIFAAYTRHMMLKLTNLPSKNGTKLVIAVNRSDREIGAELAAAYDDDQQLVNLSTDFEQHDVSHDFVTKMWFCHDMEKMGFPKTVVARYWNAYLCWAQRTNGVDNITIDNVFLQHSGSPDTIHGNTKLTMGANGACFKFEGINIAAFKGDDTYIRSKKFTVKKLSDIIKPDVDKNLADIFGFKLKIDDSDPAEFICNMVTPYGFFPDVVRRCARYISKIYTDREDFEDTRQNIRDAVAVVLSDEGKNYGIYAATKYYNMHGYTKITTGDVEMLYEFLCSDRLQYTETAREFIITSL